MGCQQSRTAPVVTENKETSIQVERWNNRRAEVLVHLDALTRLYKSIKSPPERQRLVEENRLIFTEFFQVELNQVGSLLECGTLHTYIKSPK